MLYWASQLLRLTLIISHLFLYAGRGVSPGDHERDFSLDDKHLSLKTMLIMERVCIVCMSSVEDHQPDHPTPSHPSPMCVLHTLFPWTFYLPFFIWNLLQDPYQRMHSLCMCNLFTASAKHMFISWIHELERAINLHVFPWFYVSLAVQTKQVGFLSPHVPIRLGLRSNKQTNKQASIPLRMHKSANLLRFSIINM